jgi:hypothetical protein
MDLTKTVKVCASCGVDLTRQDCFQNSSGEYRCLPCYEAVKKRSQDGAIGAVADRHDRCVLCDARVDRASCHKNRHGKYVCGKCYRSRHGGIWRRSVKKSSRWFKEHSNELFIWLACAVFVAICLWVFFSVMGKLAGPPTMG